jgi:hypothetical protein
MLYAQWVNFFGMRAVLCLLPATCALYHDVWSFNSAWNFCYMGKLRRYFFLTHVRHTFGQWNWFIYLYPFVTSYCYQNIWYMFILFFHFDLHKQARVIEQESGTSMWRIMWGLGFVDYREHTPTLQRREVQTLLLDILIYLKMDLSWAIPS